MTDHFNPELLVIDVDGTLVGRTRDIGTADKAALETAAARGIGVALCTGRVAQACRNIFAQLELNGYHIFFDGAVVSDSVVADPVYISHLDPLVLAEAIDFIHNSGVFLELFTTTDYYVDAENEFSDIRANYFGVMPGVVDFHNLAAAEPVIKGGLIISRDDEMTLAQEFMDAFAGKLEFSRGATPAFPELTFINILSPGVSKGQALRILAAHLGVPLERVMAFGDHYNDISLLETAGFSVAMGNAPDAVKKKADYVTGDVEHCGIAAALDKIVLSA